MCPLAFLVDNARGCNNRMSRTRLGAYTGIQEVAEWRRLLTKIVHSYCKATTPGDVIDRESGKYESQSHPPAGLLIGGYFFGSNRL